MRFKGISALVCGMARSGVSSALCLKAMGANVTVQDIRGIKAFEGADAELEDAGYLAAVRAAGVSLYLGRNPDGILADFELIVLSPGVPYDLPFVTKALGLGIPVWSEIELAYRLCPCPIIAVTGTNGKTTTASIVGQVMRRLYPRAQVVGNIGVPFTEKVLELTENDYAVAEISSFQLEAARDFAPHIAAVLNIKPDHLDRHGSFENYARIKHSIAKNQKETDFIILNYDDGPSREQADYRNWELRSRIVYFSRLKELDSGVYVKDGALHIRLDGLDADIINIDELRILGPHNAENALAAAAMCACAGVPPAEIRAGLKAFKAVEHRIEYVACIDGVTFYNDSKGTNPDAAVKSIMSMPGEIALIGGGYDKHADFSEWVSLFPGRVAFLAVIGQVADQLIDACEASGFKNYQRVGGLREAVRLCFAKSRPGGCVLLSPACASWDMFENYEQRGRLFKEYVAELAEEYETSQP